MRQRLKRIALTLVRQKYFWTLLAFVIIVGFLDPNSFLQRYRLHSQNEALRSQIKTYEDQYAQDTRELYELERSPEAVERVARVDLYMKTPDEDIYVIK